MPAILFGWSLISVFWSLLATLLIGVVLRFVGIYQWIYQLWLQCSTWFLNLILSSILVWWFHLPSVTITVADFGFCSVRGVKIKWMDGPGVSIDEVTFQIDWEPNNIRNISVVFHVKKARTELFTNLKDAKMESSTSFTLHWKVHSTGDLISNNIRSSSETIPKAFHLLYVTDLEIGTTLYLQTGKSFVALLEATTVSALLIPTEQATTFILKGMEATYCCGCCDIGFIQARQEKTLTISLIDFEGTWSSQGPARFTICSHNVQLSLNPRKVNYALLFLNHLWLQVMDHVEDAEHSADNTDAGNGNKSVEVSVMAENCKMCLCLQDGQEAVNVSWSFNLNSQLRNQKTQYTAAIGVQAIVPSTHQEAVPCAILGNEMISAPWMCTLLGSHVAGNCTVARVFSDQSLCVVLRSESVAALTAFYQEYSSSLDLAEMSDLCAWITRESNHQNPQLQVSLDFKGARLCLQMELFEEILNVSLENIKGDVSRDQHNTMCDMSVKDFEVEDCVSKVFAVQQPRPSNDDISRPVLFFSFLQDEVVKVIKKLHIRLGELSVSVEEALLLKLLQFGGVKDKAQLWGEEGTNDQDSLAISRYPNLLTVQPCFFEKIEFEPFVVTVKCSPAKQLLEEQQLLKSKLAIPSGFPPLMEKTSVQFGEFLRTWISYRTWLAFVRDVRRHYLKEIGRHSGSLLGSLHLLGNLSSLHEGIADGLTDLKETGDYIEFVKHVRGGLAESYYKFTDSWSACIKKSATKNDKIPSPSCSSNEATDGSSMNSVRGVVESLTSFIFSPSSESSQREIQFPSEPSEKQPASAPDSPQCVRGSRRAMLTDSEDHESSESETSSVSCVKSADDWELVPRDAQRLLKGQEFLRRMQVSLNGEPNEEERFVSCLKLRYRNPEDMLNALVTTQNVYFMKVGLPTSEHVVLNIKLVDLYKARYKVEDEEHLLELRMKISGGRRLSLPSPDPADSPMVRCATGKVAQKAAKVINDAKKRSEQKNS